MQLRRIHLYHGILEQLSRPRFFSTLKFHGLLSHLFRTEKREGNFKTRKKSWSRKFFPCKGLKNNSLFNNKVMFSFQCCIRYQHLRLSQAKREMESSEKHRLISLGDYRVTSKGSNQATARGKSLYRVRQKISLAGLNFRSPPCRIAVFEEQQKISHFYDCVSAHRSRIRPFCSESPKSELL